MPNLLSNIKIFLLKIKNHWSLRKLWLIVTNFHSNFSYHTIVSKSMSCAFWMNINWIMHTGTRLLGILRHSRCCTFVAECIGIVVEVAWVGVGVAIEIQTNAIAVCRAGRLACGHSRCRVRGASQGIGIFHTSSITHWGIKKTHMQKPTNNKTKQTDFIYLGQCKGYLIAIHCT